MNTFGKMSYDEFSILKSNYKFDFISFYFKMYNKKYIKKSLKTFITSITSFKQFSYIYYIYKNTPQMKKINILKYNFNIIVDCIYKWGEGKVCTRMFGNI